MDFIFVSLQRINTDRESTSTSLAKDLAKRHRVLYVNPPIDRKAWLLSSEDPFIIDHIQQIRRKSAGLVKENEQLWILTPPRVIESINWLPSTKIFSLFNKINNKRFAGDILRSIKELNFQNFILINDKDIFRSFYLKELLKPKHAVYLDRDYILGYNYWKRHGTTLEPELIRKYDAVVSNSSDFTQKNKKYNKNSFYISNGADLENFSDVRMWDEPTELIGLARPIIGYIGALTSSRLDISLISAIANRLKSGTIVLIGPQDNDFRKSELHDIPNVLFIEKKRTDIVPAYLKCFDVSINPQLMNEITLGNFPLKIVEYLGMGKPVVATATNTMKEVFSEYVYLANTHKEFHDCIQTALREDNTILKEKRIDFSRNFSWGRVANNVLSVITKLDEANAVS